MPLETLSRKGTGGFPLLPEGLYTIQKAGVSVRTNHWTTWDSEKPGEEETTSAVSYQEW